MSNTVIKIENLSKIYRLGEIGTGTLSHDLNRWWQMNIRGKDDPYALVGGVNDRTAKARKGEHIAALKDINLEVKQGEVLGIIGKNGAGKSTLLKVLSRVTSPTTGSISVKGRLASLLEVGTGFHPEMTGRENIYMNGTIMGMRKWEISRKLEEIVEFAGVAKYLDTPVKRYSSGMKVRLGFAVAAHLEPEILVVDEVLAVGDAEFQKKAIGKMQDVSTNDGRTVLFVSHNMTSLQNLCHKGTLLINGENTYYGSINNVIDKYINTNTLSAIATYTKFRRKNDYNAHIKSIALRNVDTLQLQSSFKMGEDILIELDITSEQDLGDFIISIRLNDSYNNKIAAWRSNELGIPLRMKNRMTVKIILKKLNIFDGIYNLSASLVKKSNVLDYIDNSMNFEIIPAPIGIFGKVVSKDNNIIYTDSEWQF